MNNENTLNLSRSVKYNKCMILLSLISNIAFSSEGFNITGAYLLGDVTKFDHYQQNAIINVIKNLQGKNKNIEQLQQTKTELQILLNSFGDDYYIVDIPDQTITKGIIALEVNKIIHKVNYIGSNGYSDDNISNSLPSLKEKKFDNDGKQWFDHRELNMALENPLKTTFINYSFIPEKKESLLTASSHSPYGKYYNYIAVDNYGGREFKYNRLILGHTSSNLTGHDDVLSFNTVTNFKQPNKSYGFGLNYTYPFYKKHQNIRVGLGYSKLDSYEIDGLINGLTGKYSKGKNFIFGLDWSYYLPHINLGLNNQFKLNIGYNYRNYTQSSEIFGYHESQYSNQYRYGIGNVSIGLSGEIKLTLNSNLKFNINQSYYSPKIIGAYNMNKLISLGYSNNFNLINYDFSYNWNIINNWNINTSLAGQYTHKKIPNIDYQSITGVNYVRGFKYNGVSSDKGLVWRTELNMPNYGSFNFHNYIFYDWGKFIYNDKARKNGIVSALGLGLKGMVKKTSFDFFISKRLHNANLDCLDNGKSSDNISFWGKISYGF